MEEHAFDCPYCWEEISTLVETHKVKQQYIEDCGVCLNPMEFVVDCNDEQEVTNIRINPIAQ